MNNDPEIFSRLGELEKTQASHSTLWKQHERQADERQEMITQMVTGVAEKIELRLGNIESRFNEFYNDIKGLKKAVRNAVITAVVAVGIGLVVNQMLKPGIVMEGGKVKHQTTSTSE